MLDSIALDKGFVRTAYFDFSPGRAPNKTKHAFFFIGRSAAEQAVNWAAKCVSSL
jgi:hypothetical protein